MLRNLNISFFGERPIRANTVLVAAVVSVCCPAPGDTSFHVSALHEQPASVRAKACHSTPRASRGDGVRGFYDIGGDGVGADDKHLQHRRFN
jgi:hypothetical protein